MSSEQDKGGKRGRLWSGRDKSPAPSETPAGRLWNEPQQEDEKVLPLKKPAEEADSRIYAAFDSIDHPPRLHIQRAMSPSRFPAYSYLLDISYDHFKQSAFTLVYSFMVVNVEGFYLWRVVHAINSNKCERIREFHPDLYDYPAKGEPMIKKIDIITADEKLMKDK